MIDIYSDTWLTITKYCKDTRENLVNELIESATEDEQIRGRIQQIDKIIGLSEPDKPPLIQTANYL